MRRTFNRRAFANRLRERRNELGLSARGCDARCGIGLKQTSDYESQGRAPNVENLFKLAKGLGVTADWLIGLSNQQTAFNRIEATPTVLSSDCGRPVACTSGASLPCIRAPGHDGMCTPNPTRATPVQEERTA